MVGFVDDVDVDVDSLSFCRGSGKMQDRKERKW